MSFGVLWRTGVAIVGLAAWHGAVADTSPDPFMHAGHVRMTRLGSPHEGDAARADSVVAAARRAMAPYADYHRALADGFRIFAPDVPQHQYHFTNWRRALLARWRFDPAQPGTLLYEKTGDSTFRLVGAMYSAPPTASLAALDERVPLSVAQWHLHVNICLRGRRFEPSITAASACAAAGGRFLPHAFGWMVHVYPDSAQVWGRMGHM